jgi:hypothetical protein
MGKTNSFSPLFTKGAQLNGFFEHAADQRLFACPARLGTCPINTDCRWPSTVPVDGRHYAPCYLAGPRFGARARQHRMRYSVGLMPDTRLNTVLK